MGKNQTSVVVLQIRVKFWCMIPMGVKYNHTKFEQKTQRWRPGTGFARGGPQFQKLQFRAKTAIFGPKKPWNTQKPQILCRLAADSHKPRIGHIFGYMAQNAIQRAHNPPATPHFLWFPPLRIAQTDA